MPRTRSRAISILAALMGVPSFTTKDRTLLDQVLGLERMRAEYVRSSGTDIPDDIMLSVLVRALPKAIQQHVQLQLSETSTYDQVRAMVVSYERTTTSWSPGKIHSELGILPQSQNQSFNQPSNNTGLAPMEIDRFEKGRIKENPKEKVRVKRPPRVKGRTRATREKVSPTTRAPLALQPAMTNACTAGNTGTSNVTVGSFMAVVTRRM